MTEQAERLTRVESFLRSHLGFDTTRPGTIDSWRKNYSQRLQRLEHTVDGNGQIGLRTKVLILWHSQLWVIGLMGAIIGGVVTKILNL